jgi:hypothetical protein
MCQLLRRTTRRTATLASIVLFSAPLAAGSATEPEVTSPLGGGESVSLEPAPPPVAPRRQRAIYVCQHGGIPVYTDRPCGSTAVERTLAVAPPSTGSAPSTSVPRPRASTKPRPERSDPEANRNRATGARCESLQRELDQLNDRMRAGYSAREAARLWQRWREARDRLRAARCR